MDLMEKFEKNLRLMIKEKGLTQSQFAKNIGVGDSTVSDWLIKHKEPSATTVYKITKELNCSICDLFD